MNYKLLRTFAGCKVGEERLTILFTDSQYDSLIAKGYLTAVSNCNEGRIGLSLTTKGKVYVSSKWEQN